MERNGVQKCSDPKHTTRKHTRLKGITVGQITTKIERSEIFFVNLNCSKKKIKNVPQLKLCQKMSKKEGYSTSSLPLTTLTFDNLT